MKGMLNKNLLYNLENVLLCTLAFVIPLVKTPIPVLIALLALNRLLIWEWTAYKKIRSDPIVWIWIGFYLLFILGLLNTKNMHAGLFDLQVKFSLLLFPLLLPFITQYHKNETDRVLRCFSYGCISTAILLLAIAVWRFHISGDTDIFFYRNLSFLHHPTYLAMFCSLALLIIFRNLLKPDNPVIKNILLVNASVIIIIFICLLSSKSGIITLLIAILAGCSYLIFRYKKWLISIAILILFPAGFYVLYSNSTFVQIRLKEMVSVLEGSNPENNTRGRFPIWKAAFQTILKTPFTGQGTGDVKDALMTTFKTNEFTQGIKNNLNAHNQYLQSAIAVGITGGIWLIVMLLLPLWYALRKRQMLYAVFLIFIVVNFLFESMLETQAGVVFYAFFNSFFYYKMRKSESALQHALNIQS